MRKERFDKPVLPTFAPVAGDRRFREARPRQFTVRVVNRTGHSVDYELTSY